MGGWGWTGGEEWGVVEGRERGEGGVWRGGYRDRAGALGRGR